MAPAAQAMGDGVSTDETTKSEHDTASSDTDTQPVPHGYDDLDPFLSPKRGGTEVYLVRHGDALPEPAEVTPGDYDAQALSDLGRRQAEAVAEALCALAPAAVYSSPTGRAYQTAQAIARACGLEVAVDADVREVELGPIGAVQAGAAPDALAASLRDQMRQIAAVALGTGVWSSIPGSEPSDRLRARIVAAVDGIAARHPGQRVVVASHGGAINAYVAAILGVGRDYFFPAANTSVSVVRVRGDRHLLMALNDISHLRSSGLLAQSLQ